ncbi:uncharacterized protein LOC136091274 isoform X2 [Hydra vulgaris]
MLLQDAQGDIDLFVLKESISVSQNQLLKTFSIFPKMFEVKFEACVFSLAFSSENNNTCDKNWLNLFSFEKVSEDILSTGCETRKTFISVWLSSLNNTNIPTLTVDAEIGGKIVLSFVKIEPFSFGCTKFNIIQHLIDDYDSFSISVNDSYIVTSKNITVKEMSNIEMYVSSFKYNAQPGYIKNLRVTKLCSEHNRFNCPNEWIGHGRYCYLFKESELQKTNKWSYEKARSLCQNFGGDLLSIENEVENSFIKDQFINGKIKSNRQWIGLKFIKTIQTKRIFEWVDNTNTTFMNWGHNEPNNLNGNENCVEIKSNGWNDLSCETLLDGFFCKSKVQEKSCKPQLSFSSNLVVIKDFLYITLNLSKWNLDESAVNVIWEYLLPPFIQLQSTYTSDKTVYNDSNSHVYKIKRLPDIGVYQSITAFIDNSSCLYCGYNINIPIKLYFESTVEIAYKSFLTNFFEINCPNQNQQHQFPDFNECMKPCKWTHSVVIDDEDFYNCICDSGLKLDDNNYSCIDINECANLTNYCNWTNSDCVNTNGSYYCTCKSGWLLDKNSCVDIDECASMANYCNLTNSDCVNFNGSYNCTCKSGWQMDNNSCVDINECENLTNYCNWTNSYCMNTNGSYNCSCKSGWSLVNNSCLDIDECASMTNYCNLTNSDCVNTNGSYNCTCKSGWQLDNNSCVDINECNELAKFCNWTNSHCVNINGSYNCTCKYGWSLVNNSCVDIDECTSLNNICNSTNSACVNNIGSYYCNKGEWSTWSECSETCGLGYKYSILNVLFKSQQKAKRSLPCMNTKCPVNGNWSNWTTDESCSNSFCICTIRQERYCNNPAPADGGHDCFGINVRYLENNKICQVNGGWTKWSSWTLCSQPCQGGVKTRYRSCTNPVPKYGGLSCNGSNADEINCYSDKCKNVTVNFGIIFTDEDYAVYKLIEEKIKTAIQNLYKKFNKTVPFNLKLNSIKNVKSYETNP